MRFTPGADHGPALRGKGRMDGQRSTQGPTGKELLGEGAEVPGGCQKQVMETWSQGQRKETGFLCPMCSVTW